MRVAFVTTQLFDTPRNGGEMCSARLLGELRQAGHELQVIGRGAAAGRVSDALHRVSVGAAVPAFETMPRHRQLMSLCAALASRRASTVQRLSAGGVPAQVRQLLAAAPAAELLVIDHLQPFAWLPAAAVRLAPMLLVMHNLEADGYAERALLAAAAGRPLAAAVFRREFRLLRRLEVRALRQAAVVACLSESDAAALRLLAERCGARVPFLVLPGYPLDTPPAPGPVPAAPGRRIGMLGTWTWGPNQAALRWMIEQVLPLLPAHCTLVLAGSGLAQRDLPARVQSLGRVEDTHRFYDSVDVVAIPSLGGSGVHEKAIEAIASARPVVATTHALRGLGPGLPPHVHTSDQPGVFARLCAQVPASAGSAAAVQTWATARVALYRQALAQCLHAAQRARC